MPAVQRVLRLLLFTAPWLALSGCQGGIGPTTLGAGRGAYADVVARTNSEQMLGLIVRMRYSDPIGLLTVSSVTANLRFSLQAASQAGFGSQSNYAGNLVPFSAGVVYEDNPTISYAPVDEQAFLREWLTPVSLGLLVPVMQTGGNPDALLTLLVQRINGLRSGREATPEERASFARAGERMADLRALGILAWVDASAKGKPPRYEMILSGYAPAHTAEVEELLRLLEVAGDTRRGATIRIPMALGLPVGGHTELTVQTRSVGEILRDADRAVEVPEEHVKAGVVAPSPFAPGQGGLMLRIRSSRKAPSQANVAVKHRGWWYYVDDTDLISKRTFQEIQMLFASRLFEASRNTQKSPVLTIPVK